MSERPYQPGDRRPIASRGSRAARLAAHWLAERRVPANGISIAGLLAGLAAGACLAATAVLPHSACRPWAWWMAALLVQIRLLANLMDGMVAIESGQASAVGELFNDVPDRISDAAILIGMGYAEGGMMVLGYAAACVAVFTAYVRAMGKVVGAHQEFCGPMAKQQRMFVVTLTSVLCGILTPCWGPPAGWILPGWPALALVIIVGGGLWTAVRRLRRIVRALRGTAS